MIPDQLSADDYDRLLEYHSRGFWSGYCTYPGCRTRLQGADETVIDLHAAVVHQNVTDTMAVDDGHIIQMRMRRPR